MGVERRRNWRAHLQATSDAHLRVFSPFGVRIALCSVWQKFQKALEMAPGNIKGRNLVKVTFVQKRSTAGVQISIFSPFWIHFAQVQSAHYGVCKVCKQVAECIIAVCVLSVVHIACVHRAKCRVQSALYAVCRVHIVQCATRTL